MTTQLWRKCWRQLIPPVLRCVSRPTSFLRYEWRENSFVQKVPETSHSSRFMFLVHSSSFSLVRHKRNFLHYDSPYNSTFLKLPVTAETAGFTTVSVSAGHSASFSPVRPKTSFLRHEWRKNVTLQKVPETSYTSCFTMTFMSFVHSASLSLVRRPTNILRYEWC